jgi:hypothetical protein
MSDQIPANTPFSAVAAFALLAERYGRATAHTPLTVKVTDVEGAVTYLGEPLFYSVESIAYDERRDEFVITIDESRQAPAACTLTQSHTRAWCGNPRCRER